VPAGSLLACATGRLWRPGSWPVRRLRSAVPRGVALMVGLVVAVSGCGGSTAQTTPDEHGTLSELSAIGDDELCEHAVPAAVCTRCHPELEPEFRAVGDWCGPHGVPESQCHLCHPDLDFSPLPPVPAGADVRDLSAAEALAGLERHAAPGRVTVFDFQAPWCAPCRNLEGHLRLRLAAEPDLAVRRIDVPSWEGPIVDRYLADIPGLPYVILYDRDGRRAADLAQFEPAELDLVLDGLLRGGSWAP
jgi:thiol-disulfide isomerase/thioredoxin